MANAPETVQALRGHVARALSIMADLSPDYIEARDMYNGTAAEVADSKAAAAVVEATRRAPISFAHIPVDVISNKVDLSAVTSEDANAAAALSEWSDANDLEDEADDWILKACIFGDYYVVSDPTAEDEDGNALSDSIASIGMSPLSTVVVYDRRTQRVAEYGLHVWAGGTKEQPQTYGMLYYDDCSVRLVADGRLTDSLKAEKFNLDGNVDEAFIDHDAGRMLISHLAVGAKPYGTPIHRKAWGFQDAITTISANSLVNVAALGLPSRWALVDPAAEIDDDIDDDFGTDGPLTTGTAKDSVTTATRGGRRRVVPGAIEWLRGASDTGTYEASTSDPFLAMLDWYLRGMAVATGVALFEFDMQGEQPSGESRRRAEARANRTASRVRRAATAFLSEIASTVLALMGRPGEPLVTFQPSETATDKEGLELVGLKVSNGVPLRVALLEAGYTDDQVDEWYPVGVRVPLSLDALKVLGPAIQSLAASVSLGALSGADLRAMLPELITTVATEGFVTPTADPADTGEPDDGDPFGDE